MHLSNFRGVSFDSLLRPASLRRAARAARTALQRLLPQACALCAGACGNALVCAACVIALPRITSPCPTCGLPTRGADDRTPCGTCRARPPPFRATVAAWAYDFPVDRLVQALKYDGRLALAEPFAVALVAAVARRGEPLPDVVVALPLAPARQRTRGFNQAHEIARRVAAGVGRPLVAGLERTRDAPPQAALAWSERARNVRRAFAGNAHLAGRRVALVDDVMTTGATLAAAASAARHAGAIDVEAWVVARTLPPVSRDP